ncbi:hypothetical protein KHP57_03180 [Algiphilus sp. NNCM1]|uniref:heme biosynthesis HemY N-terminal domain-containing protein n=1 Tax=Algiphilus sp. TaxID=1872431 RepID=UPI001CA61382|nr:heme biosynthesis HemY N-terminal domain-containing protein [Algiphilus sp.]MBY8964693.1 hypothetical protein [Algiphilus acroporae]MCI5062304.1 hypothetical protein [Algiphilus sp.]MCI5104534.1 hypothetical protein [Algiphilus sp.]
MRAVLLLLLLFAAGAAAAYYLRADNGYVLVTYGHWMLETSVVGFTAALVVLLVALLLLLRALGAGIRLPSSVREGLQRRRANRQHRALKQGLMQWLAGRFERAEVTVEKDLPEGKEAGAHHLIAAMAAHRQRNSDRVAHYLQRAAVIDDGLVGEATTLLQAKYAIEGGDLEAARADLEALRQRSPSHPRLYPALAQVMLAQHDWRAAYELLCTAEKARGWAGEQWTEYTLEALAGALAEALRLDEARQLWAQLPATLRKTVHAERLYAEALYRLNAEKELMTVVHRALEQRWDPVMVRLFLRAETPDHVAALASAEQWLQRHGEQPELLLAAAHTCRRNRLWGKARSYLDALIEQAPSAEAHYEYGLLCSATEQPEAARQHYEEGLRRALSA